MGSYCGWSLREIGNGCFELFNSGVEEIHAIFKSSLFECFFETSGSDSKTGDIGRGLFNFFYGVVEDRGNQLWDCFGGKIWESG